MQDRLRKLISTCDAKEKFGPGERFLLGAGGALLPGPEVLPFRFLLLLAGRCDSEKEETYREHNAARSRWPRLATCVATH